MRLASVRLITADLDRMVAFYEGLTGLTFSRPAPAFAELPTPHGATLAIGDLSSLVAFPGTDMQAAANDSAFIEFQVDDVDAVHARLGDDVTVLQPLTDMPWGNRTMTLRDPDGNRVGVYTPMTDAAKARFAGRG